MKNFDTIPDIFQKGSDETVGSLATRAQEALAGLVDSYLVQVHQDFETMKHLLAAAKTANSQDCFRLIREDFFVKMHDLKGQGATFGYPLLTDLGAFACDFLREKKTITTSDLKVLGEIVDDVGLILTNNLTGSGGDLGAAIAARLSERKNA